MEGFARPNTPADSSTRTRRSSIGPQPAGARITDSMPAIAASGFRIRRPCGEKRSPRRDTARGMSYPAQSHYVISLYQLSTYRFTAAPARGDITARRCAIPATTAPAAETRAENAGNSKHFPCDAIIFIIPDYPTDTHAEKNILYQIA